MKKRNSIKSILLLTIISFVGVACVDEIKFGNAFLEGSGRRRERRCYFIQEGIYRLFVMAVLRGTFYSV